MNIVVLIGNVASDPDLRYTPSGRAVCTFRLAVSRPGGEQAYFFEIVTWERQAEVVNEYCCIGRRVGIEGRLHASTGTDTQIVASRVQLLGAPAARNVEHDEEE